MATAQRKPTPPPWSAADEPDPIGKRYVIHSVPTATGVAHCWTKADARLIAAAPDLYDVLREAREWILGEGSIVPERLVGRISEALAKAGSDGR